MSSGPDEALAAHELDLVSRAAKGDAAAFDRFYERNAPAVQLLTERLLGPGEAADAVVVEAFEKTVRRLPLLGARNSSPALYVLSTARNGAYAALGRGRPTAEGGPLAALLALPSRQRELLALRELGLPEADCAEVAGIDPSDVGPQVARARLRLTDELEGLNLSTVFADDRAERLLAAEVVRVEGQQVPGTLAQEISSHADEDSRFAAALSAVRSPSRSVGQLPAVSGPSRLAAAARGKAVVGGAVAGGAISASASAAAAGAPPIPPPVASGPPAVPRTTSDPYDEEIGDEVAWGIVDDEDGAFSDGGGQAAGAPSVERPTDGQWADGAGAVSEEPTQLSPATPAAGAVPIPPVDPAAPPVDPNDPFAGWDDALDWDEDEKEWAAGPAAGDAPPSSAPDLAKHDPPVPPPTLEPNTIAAAAGGAEVQPVAPREPIVDLGETRAFDAVAAGLVDPDPIPVSDFDHGDDPPGGRRSPWRWIVWALAFLVLFAGVALATYAYVSARQDPEAPPASRIDETTPTSATPKPTRTPAKSSSSNSSSKTTPDRKTGSSSSSGSSSGSTGSSGSSGSSSSSGGGSSGSSGGSGGGSSTKSSGSGTSTTTKEDESSVTSGESTSGGSVRGNSDGTAGGTTP